MSRTISFLLRLNSLVFGGRWNVQLFEKGCSSLSTFKLSPKQFQWFLSEKLFVRDKPHLIVGTIGHVDHGKTTLTAAITKYLASKGSTQFRAYDQIDKAPEERSRGITIHSTMVEYETDKRHYGHIDCPGHIDYVKNMITGTAQMDGCILVVAATDGTMPQTKEHILLSKQIGIEDFVVYINKVDQMGEKDVLELVELEVTELLNKYGYDKEPVFIYGSALKALKGDTSDIGLPSIERLLAAMQENIKDPVRELEKPFLMSIEDSYSISGRGTVVTGAVIRGQLKKGEEVELVGFNKSKPRVTVNGIQMFHKDLSSAQAGDSLGALLKGMKREDIHRGMVLASPGTVKPHQVFNSQVYILKKDEGGRHTPFVTKYAPQMFFRTANVAASLKLPEGVEMVAPGDDTSLEVTLKYPMAIEQGLRFTLREGNRTIGTGVVTEIIE